MKDNITVKPDKTRLVNFLDDVASGIIRVPVFQRDFVWDERQMRELFDSISRGYPIGSLLLWKPNEKFKSHNKIGPYEIEHKSTENIYILDGFQRLTTLFAVLSNPKKFNKSEFDTDLKKYSIYYDLKNEEFTYLRNNKSTNNYFIPLYKIVDTYEFLDFLKELQDFFNDKTERDIYIENAKKISKIIYDYEIPYVEIRGGDIKSAVEIFSRVNSKGTDISEDFMLSALSYNPSNDFLLSERITEFLSELKSFGFDNLSRDTVLNCISCATNKLYFDVRFETLRERNDIEELTNTALLSLKKAIEFLYFNLNITDSKALPYPAQLIFIAEYFRLNPLPSEEQKILLEKWFWITSYSNYFTIYSISQHRMAFNLFKNFALGIHDDGIYKPDESYVFNSLKFPNKLTFLSVRSKTLQLFLLNYKKTNLAVEQDIVIEKFIISKKDRTPGNIILRLNSDIMRNQDFNTNQLNIELFTDEMQEKYFINNTLINLYIENKFEEFLEARSILILFAERTFVEGLGINYVG